MKTGDIVFHQKYGAGRIIITVYWWGYAEELKPISSVRTLIKRRQHG